MAAGIPISQIVAVTPGVIGAGGALNFLNGLILTTNTAVAAAGSVVAFTSLKDVQTAAGATSTEAQMAAVYFSGYTNATQSPSTLYFGGVTDTDASLGPQMDTLAADNQQWTGFAPAFEPDLAGKQALATWTAEQNNRFWCVLYDTDAQAIVSGATEPFGVWLKSQSISGVTAVYQDPLVAALCLGWMASLNYDATNGRQTLAFLQNSLVSASVTNGSTASILLANGYNYYGGFAGATGSFVFLNNGSVSGEFLWADSYINQIWLNAQFQYDIVELFLNVGNIPFNTQGDAMISAALQDTINQAIAFGAIRTGVTLSSTQKLELSNAVGIDISTELSTRGWYLVPGASTATPANRTARTVPGAKFWYTDGGSVQTIALASTEVA